MRGLSAAVLLLVSALASAANPTFEARSQRYALQVEIVGTEYVARVTDLASGQVIASPRIVDDKESIIDVGDRTIRVHVYEEPNEIDASLDVEQGETLVDHVSGRWALKPGPLKVGGDVKTPVVVERVNPQYPEEARQARVSGIVILAVLIDKTGVVRDVTVLKPLPKGLSEAATEAVRQWKFQPATRKDQPVGVLFNLTINFKLERDR